MVRKRKELKTQGELNEFHCYFTPNWESRYRSFVQLFEVRTRSNLDMDRHFVLYLGSNDSEWRLAL